MKKIENINDLIELMQELSEKERIDGIGFDMAWPYPNDECGSVCCIGGWINYVNNTTAADIVESFQYVAKVSNETAHSVCYPRYADGTSIEEAYNNATASDAVKVLTALRDTDKVIWDELFSESTT